MQRKLPTCARRTSPSSGSSSTPTKSAMASFNHAQGLWSQLSASGNARASSQTSCGVAMAAGSGPDAR
eukprot:3231284-Heterocapsa_arctica.AAC.1